MKLRSLWVSLIHSQFITLETAHTYLIHFHASPTVCKQLSCPPGCVVPISCRSGRVSTWPGAESPQPEGNTREALAGSRPGPECVIDPMGRQTSLPFLEGSSFLWQNVGIEGYRVPGGLKFLPSDNHLAPLLGGMLWSLADRPYLASTALVPHY